MSKDKSSGSKVNPVITSRGSFKFLLDVLAWFVTFTASLTLIVAVALPRVFGATPYTIATGSMRPIYPQGTLVVSKKIPFDQIRIGDVITYQIESGIPTTATHRVVSVGSSLDGKKYLRTKGDANDSQDVAPVKPVQVKGRLWYSVPYVGHVSNILSTSQRELVVKLIAAALILYSLMMFGSSARSKMRGIRVDAKVDLL